jgi:hypothetical protein
VAVEEAEEIREDTGPPAVEPRPSPIVNVTLPAGEVDLPTLGRLLLASGFFTDVRTAAQAVVKVMYGKELGIGPVVSMTNIFIVQNRPAMSYPLVAAMIKRHSRHDYRVKKLDDQECVLEFFEKREEEWELVGESSFSMDDARRAGLVRPGGGWQKYPRNMLFARALTNGAKFHCPDVFMGGIYTPDEFDT